MNEGYILKIKLKHIRPPIWRRIWVPGWLNLEEFHEVIQASMGWLNCHLHRFEADGKAYSIQDDAFPDDSIDESQVALKDVLKQEGHKIRYIYDFGDYWDHEILYEKKESKNSLYPYVLKGKKACPPEDCMGEPGYYRLLDILEKEENEKELSEEEQKILEWLGEDYHPDNWDITEANAALKQIKLSRH